MSVKEEIWLIYATEKVRRDVETQNKMELLELYEGIHNIKSSLENSTLCI